MGSLIGFDNMEEFDRVCRITPQPQVYAVGRILRRVRAVPSPAECIVKVTVPISRPSVYTAPAFRFAAFFPDATRDGEPVKSTRPFRCSPCRYIGLVTPYAHLFKRPDLTFAVWPCMYCRGGSQREGEGKGRQQTAVCARAKTRVVTADGFRWLRARGAVHCAPALRCRGAFACPAAPPPPLCGRRGPVLPEQARRAGRREWPPGALSPPNGA